MTNRAPVYPVVPEPTMTIRAPLEIEEVFQIVSNPVKKAPPTGGHVFQATGTIFKHVQNIIETNLLTKFHYDRTINTASRVLIWFNYSCIMKNATPPWRPYIIGTNHLTKFHDDRTIHVASTVLTRKNAPPPAIFELIQDTIWTNLVTKFHEDRKINVASRVKNAPPPGGHVFQPTSIIFKLFHEDRTINVASRVKKAPPLGSHVFSSKRIIETNLLTEFHEDWTINVASRVFTRKNAPPFGSHVFQANVTIFELIQDIIQTNLLTTFHEDWTINVAS
ncbi:hypothetical protein DPMN_177301 [Dreissena polymorpha]|uniref:Uncharacterized protein n=1 Tax=Dreissena polymorpha TaxID=45954 RepID=A0A9D4E9Z8_DREPO|nr:hypothetical protein DPMN_177301 [Dreissena polymorpha]